MSSCRRTEFHRGPLLWNSGTGLGLTYAYPFCLHLVLVDDNAALHMTGIAPEYLTGEDIMPVDQPLYSPDKNTIEHMWDEMSHWLEGVHPPSQTRQELGHFLVICGILSQLNAQGPWCRVNHILHRPLWQHMVVTLVTKLWNSNTIHQAILMWNLFFLPLLLCMILWLIQCYILLWNITDVDKVTKQPLLCLRVMEL